MEGWLYFCSWRRRYCCCHPFLFKGVRNQNFFVKIVKSHCLEIRYLRGNSFLLVSRFFHYRPRAINSNLNWRNLNFGITSTSFLKQTFHLPLLHLLSFI